MLKDTQILKNVNSDDRVIIKDYINGWIVADDTAKNLLDKSNCFVCRVQHTIYRNQDRGEASLRLRDLSQGI